MNTTLLEQAIGKTVKFGFTAFIGTALFVLPLGASAMGIADHVTRASASTLHSVVTLLGSMESTADSMQEIVSVPKVGFIQRGGQIFASDANPTGNLYRYGR